MWNNQPFNQRSSLSSMNTPFTMATSADQNKSAAVTPAMYEDNNGGRPTGNFAAFVESDPGDHEHGAEETGGGVKLRDFEDDSHTASSVQIPTPADSHSNASSGNLRAAYPRHNSATGPGPLSDKPAAASGRRNTIAPIGTGRYSESSMNGYGVDSVKASLNALFHAYTNGNEPRDLFDLAEKMCQNQTGITANMGSHTGSNQNVNMQDGYAPRSHAGLGITTPTTNGRATQYPQYGTGFGNSWGSTPGNYRGSSGAYDTPQTSGYQTGQGLGRGAGMHTNFSDITPSHMLRKAGGHPMTTPQSASIYSPSQFNQTEPRNFAPRSGIPPGPVPPPAFNLSRQGQNNSVTNGLSHFMAPDADPFLSPAGHQHNNNNNNNNKHGFSQALVLPPVPEENYLAHVSRQMAYGPVPAAIRDMRSAQLNKLTSGPSGLPSLEEALSPENFPFIESTTQGGPVGYGVIQIKNIPFGASRAEVIAFLGRNSKILNDNQEPVHIIMERVSSKTQDCFVEFMTQHDAVRAVEKHREAVHRGRPSRLGDRPVELVLSSQAVLMETLFPFAAGVSWDKGRPVVHAPVEGEPWKTFKGFVTEEELTMLVKHVEVPQRSPFSKDCPQRAYECMISTIKKLPWYMAEHITLRQRHAIYLTTMKLIGFLKQALHRDARQRQHDTVLNPQLLKRLVIAAMLCPGFSVVQKDNIAALAEMDQVRALAFNQPRLADQWVHLHGVCPRPGVPLDVLEWYVAVVREESGRHVRALPAAERNRVQHTGCHTSLYFGYLWYETGLPGGKELERMTLREVARRELEVVEAVLRRAFPSARALMMQQQQ